MNSDLKYEKVNIELRRGEVLKLLARGHSQTDIAKKLNVSSALISLDVQFLKEQAQRELRVHIKEVIPFEYARAVSGINDILRRAYDILDRMTDPKMQLQTMTLLMQCYGNIMTLATDGGIVQEAMKKVEQLKPPADTNEEERIKEDFQDEEESEPIEPEEDLREE